MAKSLPRLCLTMIVKNESKIIKRCLDSVKDHIDYWVIVDTGSTDDTQSIIKKELSSIPGKLYQSEFINFSHNRNEAVSLSREKADYLLLMDADLEFKVNNPNFKETLQKLKADSYMISECDDISEGACAGFNYKNKKIINTSKDWHYVGATHEVIELKNNEVDNKVNFEDVWLHNRYDGGSKHDKFERDARLLLQEIETDPENTRTMFYLGETFLNLFYKDKSNTENLENAIKWYSLRASKLDSWHQEVYYSLFKLARARSMRDGSFDFEGYLKAYDFMPCRLEPIHEIVKYCRENELYRIGYIIGQMALDNIAPLPEDSLFVSGDVYSYQLMDEVSICASWSGDNKTSCNIIESILPIVEGYVSKENESRIKENLKICRNLLAENV